MHCVFLANHSKLPFTFCLIVWYPQYRQFDDPDYIRAEVDGARVARHLFFDPKPHSIRKPTDRCFFTSGKKNLQKSQVHAWCLFDIHDMCLIPPKKYLTNFFPLRFFQPFFRRHPIHPGRRKNPPFEIQAFDAPRDTWQQMGWVVWVVGRPCWHPALIFLASNYLQRPPTQWWLTLLLRLHTSDVGVHVLPHLPSLEALRCPPWHLRCFVHKEKLVTKRAET